MTDESWSQTYSGERFYYGDSLPQNVIKIEDIAHQLALTNRYGGCSRYPYSVAQHSVLVADALWTAFGDPYLALDGLMHDAAEAYGTGDVIQPAKRLLPDVKALEKRIDARIREVFKDVGLLQQESPRTKFFDLRILHDEKAALLNDAMIWGVLDGVAPLNVTIVEMHWSEAKKKFLEAFGGLAALIRHRERGRLLANDLHVI
jgi:hypothetical protein